MFKLSVVLQKYVNCLLLLFVRLRWGGHPSSVCEFGIAQKMKICNIPLSQRSVGPSPSLRGLPNKISKTLTYQVESFSPSPATGSNTASFKTLQHLKAMSATPSESSL